MSFRLAIVVIAFSLGVGAAQTHSGGTSLKEAQATLKQQGYYEGAVDGLYGPQTRAALERYQREHDLKATGHLDSATASSFHKGTAGGAVQQTVNETKKGAHEAKQAVRTDESGSAGSGKPQGAEPGAGKPQGAVNDAEESAKQGANATKEGAHEAKQAVRTDESGAAGSAKPQGAVKAGTKSAKEGASDVSKEAKGALGEMKGALGTGDSSKKKDKTK